MDFTLSYVQCKMNYILYLEVVISRAKIRYSPNCEVHNSVVKLIVSKYN